MVLNRHEDVNYIANDEKEALTLTREKLQEFTKAGQLD